MILGHNVAYRREVVGRDPFGPFTGRVGGDRYLTEYLRRNGHRIVLVPGMRIRHEDITFSLRGTLERHVREHLLPVPYGRPEQRFSLAFTLASLLVRPILRMQRQFRARRPLGLRLRHTPIVLAVNAAYAAFDAVAVLVVLAVPTLRRRWLDFLIGTRGAPRVAGAEETASRPERCMAGADGGAARAAAFDTARRVLRSNSNNSGGESRDKGERLKRETP
jgi:hypothetical protein